MKGFVIVWLKEIADAARDRRGTLGALLGAPLGMPLLLGAAAFWMVEDRLDEIVETVTMPVIGGHAAPNLMAQLRSAGINPDHDSFADRPSLADAVRSGEVAAGVVVAKDFGEALQSGAPARVWIVSDASSISSTIAGARLHDAVASYDRALGAGRLLLRGVDPLAARPIAVLQDDVSTPRGRTAMVLGMMTYILLFVMIIGGSQVAMDATVGERERGSLEPLLAMPVGRSALVAGKIFAAASYMATALAVCIGTVAVAARWLPLAQAGLSLQLGLATSAAIWAAMAPFALIAASASTLLSSFAKTLKEAWTYNGLAMLLPTLPIVFVVAKPLGIGLPLMFVPSLSQHLLVTQLVKGEAVDPMHFVASVASTAAVAALLGGAATLRYRGERILG